MKNQKTKGLAPVAKQKAKPSIAATSKETADVNKDTTARFHLYQSAKVAMSEVDGFAAWTVIYEGQQYIVVSPILPKIERTSLLRSFLKHPPKVEAAVRAITFEAVDEIMSKFKEVPNA